MYTYSYFGQSFYFAMKDGTKIQSGLQKATCFLASQAGSREQMGEKPSACIFFHLNLFIPLFKHKSLVCQPLMYVEGGLCFQHLLIDLANPHPAW